MRTLGTLTGAKGETLKMTTFDIRFHDTYHTNTSCMRVCTSRQSMQGVHQHNNWTPYTAQCYGLKEEEVVFHD